MTKGMKTGGRKKGTPNRVKPAEKVKAKLRGLMPLDYMLKIMRSQDKDVTVERKDDMAAKAAPYCHPRYSTVELTGHGGKAIQSEVTVNVRFIKPGAGK